MRDAVIAVCAGELYKSMRGDYPRLSGEEFDTLFNASLSLSYGEAAFSDKKINPVLRKKLTDNFSRRAAGTAVEYITGSVEFMGLTLEMKEGVFIPKNSTETLVERLLERSSAGMTLIDMGCGSGNISIAASKLGKLSVTACDINPAALALTRKNAGKLGENIKILRSDLFADVKGRFDIIASNPPYIPSGETLDEAVLSQPAEALFSGADGLDCIRKLAVRSRDYLNDGGYLLIEIGELQERAVSNILNAGGWKNVNFYKDLSGIMRVAEASC
ncbi:MAG: peptide chain release factor N(5)-glutamine methyltransferase [Elusimicrobiota bacterium]|nr:peptide chain release factor N(5)-glutamine methyltransferase [Elusimicrobiota bacterium]